MNLTAERRRMIRLVGDQHSMSDMPTVREMQVLYLLALGYTNDAIGKVLYLSEDTVKTHVRRSFTKIKAHNRPHAVTVLFQRGILRIERPSGRLVSMIANDEMPEVAA